MELYTIGTKYHKAIKMPFSINLDEDFKTNINLSSRYKVILLEKGNALININDKKFIVNSPAVICLNERDTASTDKSGELSARAIYFHPGTINSKFKFEVLNDPDRSLSQTENLDIFILHQFLDDKKSKCFHLNQAAFKKTQGLFRVIHDKLTVQDEEFWPCKSRAYLIELLFLIRRIYDDASGIEDIALENADENINNIMLYLHSNYEKKITIPDLTRRFATNRTTLSESFMKKTGMTVMEYLRKIRIDIACQMLRDTSCDIAEIMDRTGFTEPSNFGRVFKKITGYNPSQYKSLFFCQIEYKN